MKSILIIILLLSSSICLASQYTYNIQKAGYAFDQYDEKGSISFDTFLSEFRSFPWKDQVGKSNGGTEPTISVSNKIANIDLWVSVIGTSDEYAYLVGIVQDKKGVSNRWVTAYIFEKSEWVEQAFKMYFDDQINQLNQQLSALPPFLSQEALK